MNFFGFFDEWNGKVAKFPGALDGECITLIRAYCKEVLGLPDNTMAYRNAKDIWLTRNWNSVANFQFITNTWYNVPKQGDIIVFGDKVGKDGHICAFNTGNVLRFHSIDANWGPDRNVRDVSHSYYGCLGFLRRK